MLFLRQSAVNPRLNTTHIRRLTRFLLVLPLFLLACSRAGEHEALFRQVESVVSDHPDSAMVLLQRIEEPERLDSADWARWALLTTQARDKAFIRHTTDSVINRVADYYQRFGDNHQKALAYYYVGRVNSDLGQLKRATDAYLRASDYSAKTDDHNLSFLILTQMGARFAYQGLTHEAERAYQKAFEIATQANDSVNMAFGFAYLARVSGLRKDWAQAENYYLESIAIAEKIGHSHAFKLGVQELASVYSRRNRLDKALVWARRLVEFEGLDGLPDRLSAHLVIGNIYRKLGQVDSAYLYISHAIGSYNIYTRSSAYQALYFMYRDMGRLEEATKYNDLYQSCQDSIAKMGSASDLYQVKEAHEAVNRQVVDTRRWLSAGAVVLALLVALGYFYYRYRIGRRRMERQARDYEERLAHQENEASRSAFVNSPLYSRFHDKHEIWTPTAEDWEALSQGVDSVFAGFGAALDESLPHLSLVERRLCYLVKIGVKPGVIARLLCCSDSAVSMYRKRLYEKATGQSGSAKDFDRYISEL